MPRITAEHEAAINRNLETLWQKRNLCNRVYYHMIFRQMRNAGCFPHDRETRILDLGCGDGYILDYFYRRGLTRIVGFDYKPNVLERPYPFPIIAGRIPHDLGLLENRAPFDVVLIFAVLHHLEPEQLAVMFSRIGDLTHARSTIVIWEPYPTWVFRAMCMAAAIPPLRVIPWIRFIHNTMRLEGEIIEAFVRYFYRRQQREVSVREEVIAPFSVFRLRDCLHGKFLALKKGLG